MTITTSIATHGNTARPKQSIHCWNKSFLALEWLYWLWIYACYWKQGKSEGFDSCDRPSNLAQIWSKSSIFQPVWPWNLWMTLENNRALLLYYIKLCASFQIHRWIETEVTVRKHSIRVKIGDFLSCVTLKFDGWPWKTIGHLFNTTPSFEHHFKSIGAFKLELQSGNAQFG